MSLFFFDKQAVLYVSRLYYLRTALSLCSPGMAFAGCISCNYDELECSELRGRGFFLLTPAHLRGGQKKGSSGETKDVGFITPWEVAWCVGGVYYYVN